MNAPAKDYALIHADLNWCLSILERIDELVQKDTLDDNEIQIIRWLVKQGLKAQKKED